MNIFSNKKSFQKKILKAKKNYEGKPYNDKPKFTFILQFFNKKHNIEKLFESFSAIDNSEFIVIDDGSIDGSSKVWHELLKDKNHIYLRTNDLYEIITYQKATRLASGKYCVYLQDDDLPNDFNWLKNADKLFSQYPKLIILGCRNGMFVRPYDKVTGDPEKDRYRMEGEEGGGAGVNKYRILSMPEYTCPATKIPFMFVMAINRAPMIVKKEEFLELGGFNQDFAPFQCDDVFSSLTAWEKGYQVGFIHSNFERDIGKGGMRSFNQDIVPQQATKNWSKIYHLFHESIHGDLENKIMRVNQEELIAKK